MYHSNMKKMRKEREIYWGNVFIKHVKEINTLHRVYDVLRRKSVKQDTETTGRMSTTARSCSSRWDAILLCHMSHLEERERV
jgi:hypothetical protein